MATSEEEKYRVVLHDPAANDLGEMTKTEVYGYVRTRLWNNIGAAEAVLRELEEKGAATVYFESSLGPKIRVEIVSTKIHFHIRWSRAAHLDWECFNTREEAEKGATELASPGEAYTIEQRDETCERCRAKSTSA